jgi:hypothetical protein
VQDRYAGDVGDFGKFALLRALSARRSLAVLWYRCSGESERNNDGRHVGYLEQPGRFRQLDPEVFDAMANIVSSGRRSLVALEAACLLRGAKYHGETVPRSRDERRAWFIAMSKGIAQSDLVFADMDNGFEWTRLNPKCIARDEVSALLRADRSLLLYHHQTRRKGGAAAEYRRLVAWLFDAGARDVEAVRLRPYTSRFYMLVDGDEVLSAALLSFAQRWGDEAEHFPRVVRG